MTPAAACSALRSYLFVPGDKPRMLERAAGTDADAVIADLEDAVAEEGKTAAREAVIEHLSARGGDPHGPRIFVRINDLEGTHWLRDLEAVLPHAPAGIVLPKPRSGADVTRLSKALDRWEAEHGVPADGAVPIVAIATERAQSLLAIASYQGASPRLAALAWGTEDLSAEIGARTAHDGAGGLTSPFRLARDLCLLGATAAGVPAIDQVYTAVRDLDGLDREARAAARDGFTGKLVIHPDQVAVANTAFTPAAEDVAAAEALVGAFLARGSSTGAFLHDGRMVDAPHLARAERLLARAKRLRMGK